MYTHAHLCTHMLIIMHTRDFPKHLDSHIGIHMYRHTHVYIHSFTKSFIVIHIFPQLPIYMSTYKFSYTHIHIHIHFQTCAHMYTKPLNYKRVKNTLINNYTKTHTHWNVHNFAYIYICILTHLHIYLHTYTRMFGWVLWYINHCWLFNAKSCFYIY